MPGIVLASSSPYRRKLLKKLGLSFASSSPNIDESALPDEAPGALVARLARAKASVLAASHPESLIIGSDQVAVLDDKILTKPHTFQRAKQQLQHSSGRTVQFLTGLCLLNTRTGSDQCEVVPFDVSFRHLSEQQIENYLLKEEPYDCAGSFKSEGLGITLFERLSGDDPNTLVGLPLIRLTAMLAKEGIDPLKG